MQKNPVFSGVDSVAVSESGQRVKIKVVKLHISSLHIFTIIADKFIDYQFLKICKCLFFLSATIIP